jgi:precorrin-6B methylase 2
MHFLDAGCGHGKVKTEDIFNWVKKVEVVSLGRRRNSLRITWQAAAAFSRISSLSFPQALYLHPPDSVQGDEARPALRAA